MELVKVREVDDAAERDNDNSIRPAGSDVKGHENLPPSSRGRDSRLIQGGKDRYAKRIPLSAGLQGRTGESRRGLSPDKS